MNTVIACLAGPGRVAVAVLAAVLLTGADAAASSNLPPSEASTPKQFYNEGTRRFEDGKLREAEAALQTAVASNEERLQPSALYNLAHVRFKQGAEVLKQSPDGQQSRGRAEAASGAADQAIQRAEAALREETVEAMLRAYLEGRGARKELKAAAEAVKQALEAHGAVLTRWQRASGDFKSAHELRPTFADAQTNGALVDRHIAELIDRQQMMMMCMGGCGMKLEQLKALLKKLKGKLPEGSCPGGEEDDEEDGKNGQKEPKEQEGPGREREADKGRPRALTFEEAYLLLDSFKFDLHRKLPMRGMGDEEKDVPMPKGRDW